MGVLNTSTIIVSEPNATDVTPSTSNITGTFVYYPMGKVGCTKKKTGRAAFSLEVRDFGTCLPECVKRRREEECGVDCQFRNAMPGGANITSEVKCKWTATNGGLWSDIGVFFKEYFRYFRVYYTLK